MNIFEMIESIARQPFCMMNDRVSLLLFALPFFLLNLEKRLSYEMREVTGV